MESMITPDTQMFFIALLAECLLGVCFQQTPLCIIETTAWLSMLAVATLTGVATCIVLYQTFTLH